MGIAALTAGVLALAALGGFVVARRQAARVGWLLIVIGLGYSLAVAAQEVAYFAAVRGDNLGAGRVAVVVMDGSFTVALVAVMLFGLVFPDGYLLSTRWRPVAGAAVALGVAACATSVLHAAGMDDIARYLDRGEYPGGEAASLGLEVAVVVLLGLSAWALLLRLRRTRGPERQQVKWVVLAGAVLVVHYPVGLAIPSDTVAKLVPGVALVLVTGAVGMALLRHRLWDVDAVIRGSVVYGVLWAAIGAAYVVAAAALGLTVGSRLPVGVAIVTTVVAAMAFQPARRGLERLADRWVFGSRAPPHQALKGLGELLERADQPDDIAAHLARTATAAVGLAWVQVDIIGHRQVSVGHQNQESVTVVPVVRGGEDIGRLLCQPRPGCTVSTDDETLLSALVAQAALAISHARLASRVVHAQAAERRRIERDIHDGAQQELVALVAQLGLAGANANGDRAVFERLQRDAQRILADLRDLAQGIHPSVLTDGGLFEAVSDSATRLPIPVAVEVPAELRGRRFDEDLEATAYFFVAEALTNVVKHAAANTAQVRFFQHDSTLAVEVSDDGRGFDTTATRLRGLVGLADRVQAVGGWVVVDSRPGAGTRVTAALPHAAQART